MKRQWLLLVLVALILSTAYPVSVRAGDPGWWHRRMIHIDNTHNNQEWRDYQVRISLDQSNFNFEDLFGNLTSQIRLTDEDHLTLLDYWVEHYDAKSKQAVVWVKVPLIRASATKTIYLYYTNINGTSRASAERVFNLYEDFGQPGTGYFELGAATVVLGRTQTWETSALQPLSVVELNRDGYRYWGYYGLASCGGIGLARSNDLLHWEKYARNPIIPRAGARWPSVILAGDTLYMAHEDDGCANSYIVLRTSKDGLDFGTPDDYQLLTAPQQGLRTLTPSLFYDTARKRYYLYRVVVSGPENERSLVARGGASASKLSEDVTDKWLMGGLREMSAPQLMSYEGVYFLALQGRDAYRQTVVYSSDEPAGIFKLLPGNPIVRGSSGCYTAYLFADTLHTFTCQDDGGGIVHRAAPLANGRLDHRLLNTERWSGADAGWSTTSDESDSAHGVVLKGAHAQGGVLRLAGLNGADYALDIAGRLVAGSVWSVGIRSTDQGMYRLDLRADQRRISLSRVTGGASTLLAQESLEETNLSKWFDVTLSVYGPEVNVIVNQQVNLHATDGQLKEGGVVLLSPAGANVRFDSLRARQIAPASIGVAIDPKPENIAGSSVSDLLSDQVAHAQKTSQEADGAQQAPTPKPSSQGQGGEWFYLGAIGGILVLVVVGFVVLGRRGE